MESALISADQDFPDLSIHAQQEKESDEKLTHYMDGLIAKMPVHCQKIVHYVYYDNVPVEELLKGWDTTAPIPPAMSNISACSR